MENEETLDHEMPEMQDTAADSPEESSAVLCRWLTPDDEGDEEAGYGYGV